MNEDKVSWQREMVWAIERVGFPVLIAILMTVGLAYALHWQFDFYRESLRDTTAALRGIQTEQVRSNLLMEKLLILHEAKMLGVKQ